MSRGPWWGLAILLVISTTAALAQQSAPRAPSQVAVLADSPLPYPGGSGALGGWPMAGANAGRTSSSPADVSTATSISWYRPIEAFISGTTQLITAGGRVYVATARGLVVLNAETGAVTCRFDTELPVSTPTVEGTTVYVPGYDRTLYALNASNCAVLWRFTGANAGFSANPVVVDGRVYLGSRDGTFYAVNAANGSQAWSYPTGGSIMQSAAYDNGRLYFASMDMYGYALQASSGALVWRTPAKLPGEQYTTWWPVIHGDYVVWAGATAYRFDSSPGALDVGPDGVDFDEFFGVPTTTQSAGTVVGSSNGSHGWPAGSSVMSTTTGSGPHTLQGWADAYPARRVYAIVSKSNGAEPFYLPMLESGQNSMGQMHPPVSDGTSLYFDGPYQRAGANIPRARPMAWKLGTPWLRLVGGVTFAADEPLILSMAGGRIMANLCCDREARVLEPQSVRFWSYGGFLLNDLLPSQSDPNAYDPMWAFYDGEDFLERLGGYYNGNSNSRNGVYNSHGMQNPLVPLAYVNGSSQRVERLFTHRSNTIIAIGPAPTKTPLPLVTINPSPANPARTLTGSQLRARLEAEVRRMVDLYQSEGTDGFLRPAYISDGGGISNSMIMPEPDEYFQVPADTLYTLSAAYPYLTATLQSQLRAYLAAYWQKYFVTNLVRRVGWSGAPRESMDYPAEVAARMAQIGDATGGAMPPRVFYAAWKYAQLVPNEAAAIYAAVRPLLVYPPPPSLDIVRGPGQYNDYIVGYQGFLSLYDLAGVHDPSLRSGVANQLATLLDIRLNNFAKDHPWEGSVDNPDGIRVNNYVRRFNCTRNFLYMTPDLGQAMRSSSRSSLIATAIDEYTYVCPQWFIARDQNTFQEGSAHHIFDSHALFLAKAYVDGASQSELSKWLDVPWMLGDLYHIQNLTAALSAGGS
jgi:PQQ-like domain